MITILKAVTVIVFIVGVIWVCCTGRGPDAPA